MRFLTALTSAISGMAVDAAAATWHVTPAGSDSNSGSASRPWQSLAKAAASVSPGDTVIVAGGTYREILIPSQSGTENAWIEFVAADGEVPVIDGAGQRLTSARKGLVYFEDAISYVRLRGFEVRNIDNSTSSSRDPIGIAFRDEAHHIEIIDCNVHSITTHRDDRTPKGYSIEGQAHDITISGGSVTDVHTTHDSGNAHGIAVYGEVNTPVTGLSIHGVTVRDLTLGTSEAVVVNGNVTDFSITSCTIYNCNNIAIDVIGFEGVGPGNLDQARDGRIAGNVIYNISTRNNPSYNSYTCAGIYVDGGRDTLIERNKVYNCDIGIELASESPSGTTSGVIVRDNVVWHNSIAGIMLGGYARGLGTTDSCIIENNTFYENDTRRSQIGEVNLRYRTINNTFRNNIFKAGQQGWFVTSPQVFAGSSSGNVLDGNVYFTTARELGWEWNGQWAWNWNLFRNISGQESAGRYADPRFAGSPDATDGLTLLPDSSLIDGGLSVTSEPGRLDAAGEVRIFGDNIDIGAYELQNSRASDPFIVQIVATEEGREITIVPESMLASTTNLRIEFSSDGKNWETIGDYLPDEERWQADHPDIGEEAENPKKLVDYRWIHEGWYRAASGTSAGN